VFHIAEFVIKDKKFPQYLYALLGNGAASPF